jgi:hypothetical protein
MFHPRPQDIFIPLSSLHNSLEVDITSHQRYRKIPRYNCYNSPSTLRIFSWCPSSLNRAYVEPSSSIFYNELKLHHKERAKSSRLVIARKQFENLQQRPDRISLIISYAASNPPPHAWSVPLSYQLLRQVTFVKGISKFICKQGPQSI